MLSPKNGTKMESANLVPDCYSQYGYVMAITLYSLAVYHDFKGPLFFVRQSGPCLKLQAIVLVMTGTENEVLVHNHGPVVLLAMPRTIGPWLWPNSTKISQKVYTILELWSYFCHSFTK